MPRTKKSFLYDRDNALVSELANTKQSQRRNSWYTSFASAHQVDGSARFLSEMKRVFPEDCFETMKNIVAKQNTFTEPFTPKEKDLLNLLDSFMEFLCLLARDRQDEDKRKQIDKIISPPSYNLPLLENALLSDEDALWCFSNVLYYICALHYTKPQIFNNYKNAITPPVQEELDHITSCVAEDQEKCKMARQANLLETANKDNEVVVLMDAAPVRRRVFCP